MISGIYGMNPTQPPLASHPLSLVVFVGVTVCVATDMLAYFRREGWF